MIRSLESPGCVLGERLGPERSLPKSRVDRVVEPLHPDRHPRPTACARPAVREAVQGPPERSTETNLEREEERPRDPSALRADGVTDAIDIRRNLALPQCGG